MEYSNVYLIFPLLICSSLAATIPRNGQTMYNGQFTDLGLQWDSNLANPKSTLFSQTKATYEDSIKAALVANDSSTYSSSEVTVVEFQGQRTSSTQTATIVEFALSVDDKKSASDVENDLEDGASSKNDQWRNINVDGADIPPLPEVDHSAGWQAAASMILASINTSVDPCQDFFRYSCDNYNLKHPLGGASSRSTFGDLQGSIFAHLTNTYEQMSTAATPPPSQTLKLSIDIYNSCKRITPQTFAGPTIVLDIADEYGGWPIIDPTWDISRVPHDVYWTMGDISTNYGVATLFNPVVEIDVENIQRHILYLDEAKLLIPADYYRSPNLTDRYQNLLKTMIYQTVQQLVHDVDNDTVLPQIDRMVQIEVDLAMISVNSSDMRNQTLGYNPYDMNTAQHEFPDFNWSSYLTGLIHLIYTDDPAQLLNPFVIMEPKRYGRDLDAFVANCNKDPSAMKDLVNYLIFRLIYPYMKFAGPELSQLAKEFKNELQLNPPHITLQEEECVEVQVVGLPYATGRVYIDNYFNTPIRDDVGVMINNVLSAFSSSMSGLVWMDNESALRAFQKVGGLVKNVAYPDFQEDDAKLDAYHDWLIKACQSIDPKQPQAFYPYTRQIVLFQGQLMFGKLKQTPDRTEFGSSAAVVNAWYQPQRNSITFPAAILNSPFYQIDYPRAVNYGGLGVVMGHELSHGFDDQGIQYDWDGSLHTWMTPYAQSGFNNMAQCVVDQYSQFCYPQGCVNGIATQGEDIGDNGGLKASYNAYQAYVEAHGEEKRLPGLETFTMDQIFFISQGMLWCGEYSDDTLTKILLTDPHSPGKDRVIGEMQNFPKFAEAFECKKGDYMYPVNSCDVW